MPTYWVDGFITILAKVEVEADTPEEAIEKAERDEWTSMIEEGSWKTGGGFEALDPEDHSPELVDDDTDDDTDAEQEDDDDDD